ncbi:amino acid adenylation domain-containing protein [Streptomyces sp. NPDC057052]|uniref:amino acid adenylation domain-containing protein n=1 Tax=Streptomyces sp. NPDC057052 TaxID=3346010 RepID=UPI00364324FB
MPADAAERAVADCWAAVLGHPPHSGSEDFFHAGGQSFTAALLVAKLSGAVTAHVTVRDVFSLRTPEGLAALVRANTGPAPAAPPGSPSAPRRQPASNAQRRMWFLERYEDEEVRTYNMVEAYRLGVPVTPQALTAALDAVLERHEALRTALVADGDRLDQVVLDVARCRPDLIVERVTPAQAPAALDSAVAAEQRHRFDLGSGRLLRARWLDEGAGVGVLLLTVHHSACDGWSLSVVLSDLVAALRGAAPRPVPVQYRDHTAWLSAYLDGPEGRADRAYWRQALEGPPPADLPLDRPRGTTRRTSGGMVSVPLDLPQGALARLCREADVTPFMVCVAAVRVLLYRLTGERDVPLGTVVAGRGQPGSESSVGMFANTVVLRTAVDPELPFRSALAAVRRTAHAMMAHERYPFDALVDDLGTERVAGRNPLFDVFVETVVERYPGTVDEVTRLPREPLVSDFDLMFAFVTGDGADAVRVHYRDDVFDRRTAQRVGEQFRELLGGLLDRADAAAGSVPVLPPHQRDFLVHQVNRTAAPYPRERTLLDLVHRQIGRRPGDPAVTCGASTLTYGQLDRSATRLAAALRAAAPAAPGALVAVVCERTEHLVVALLAVLRTGAAFLPLDPRQPRARTAAVLARSGAVAVLADGPYASLCREITQVPVLDPRQPLPEPERPVGQPGATAGDLAYAVCTSGSTGEPKLVAVEHRGIVNTVHHRVRHYGLDGTSRVLQIPPVHFDSGISDVFSALAAGTPLVVLSRTELLDPHAVRAAVAGHGITHVMLVPSLYDVLLDGPTEELRSLRQVVLVGERLPAALAERHAALVPRARLFNEYGPAEDSVWTTVSEVDPADADVLIGRPIANKAVDLLDEQGRLVPLGVPGEICISGDGLARGYLGDEALTARRFVPHPFRPGVRMYRSGDLARRRADGQLEYLGRIDDQVKIRGQRVEPGEIAAVLSGAPGVRTSAVVTVAEADGAPRLVAYVVGSATPVALRAHLAERLPDAMIPEQFVPLAELPVTSNGKLDRRALPAPRSPRPRPAPASSPLERTVREVWERALGHPVTDLDASLFLLGGHSLTAARIAQELTGRLGRHVPVVAVFTHRGIRALAAHLAAGAGTREDHPAPGAAAVEAPPRPGEEGRGEGGFPLSHAQRRIWLAARGTASPAQLICDVLPLGRRTRDDLLRRALDAVVARHGMLRTGVTGRGTALLQTTADRLPATPLTVVDVPPGTPADSDEVRHVLRDLRDTRFDPAVPPLFRVRLVRGVAGGDLLAVCAHHLVYDGASVGVFLDDLNRAYERAEADREPLLPPPAGDDRAWVLAEQSWLAGEEARAAEEFWRGRLAGLPEPVTLFPGPRPRRRGPLGLVRRHVAVERDGLGSPFATVVAALATTVHRRTGIRDLVIGCPMSLRDVTDAAGMVGCFVNAVPLRLTLAPAMPPQGVLDHVQERVLEAYEHVRLPFDVLLRRLGVRARPGHGLLFDLGVSWEDGTAMASGLNSAVLPAPTAPADADVWIYVHRHGDGLELELTYDTSLAQRDTAADLAGEIAAEVGRLAALPREPLNGSRL